METSVEEIEGEVEKESEEQKVRGVRNEEAKRKLYRGQGQEYHVGLSQNLNTGKTVAIMTILDQMAEKKSWKEARDLADDGSSRICTQHSETVEHLVAGTVNI